MSRRPIMLAALGILIAVFAAGTWFVSRPDATRLAAVQPIAAFDNLVRAHSPVLGREDAPVTVVEFFDPACEACRAFHPVVKEILATYPDDVRVVMRYTPFHGEGSETAIKVLEAARMQDMFEPVLEALLEEQPRWASHGAPSNDLIMEIAGTAGLDITAAADQIRSPDVIGVLNQDRADVEAVGIRVTPTFFVNGKPLPEFGSAELLAFVKAEVEATTAESDK
ncbi:MAG: thioredoxin domain-containing protein [Jannaschia sp.]